VAARQWCVNSVLRNASKLTIAWISLVINVHGIANVELYFLAEVGRIIVVRIKDQRLQNVQGIVNVERAEFVVRNLWKALHISRHIYHFLDLNGMTVIMGL
jgi:hypothetical protein